MRRPFRRVTKDRNPAIPVRQAADQPEGFIRVFSMRINVTSMTREELMELFQIEIDRMLYMKNEDAELGLPFELVPTQSNTTILDVYGQDVGRIWCRDEERERVAGRKPKL